MKYRDPIIALFFIGTLFGGCKQSPKSTSLKEGNTVVDQDDLGMDIEIIPIEHASAVLIWEGVTIYVDPVGDKAAFKNVPEPDIILITDIHGDHFSLETLEGLNTQKSKIVAPQAVAYKIPEKFIPQLEIIENGSQKELLGIEIKAVPMYNLREEAKDFHPRGRGNGYLLAKNGKRIYFSGDTEDIPEMRTLENIDKAFICMNLPYTMTVESAADAVLDFKPKQVYPYHYRGNPKVGDVALFKKLVGAKDPNIEVIQLDWYPDEAF